MRVLIIFTFLTCLTVQGQTDQYKDWILNQKLPDWTIHSIRDLDLSKTYKISDFINPFYLEADFNGDGQLDIAVSVEQLVTKKIGIIVIHNSTSDYFVFGAGAKFGNGGDNFNQMDIWKVHRKLNASEMTFNDDSEVEGSKQIKLKSPGINVEKSESAGGLIYWDGQGYRWAQTSD